MSKTKKIVLWLVSPYALLVLCMIIFSASSYIFSGSLPESGPDSAPIGQTIVNSIVYLMGLVAIILMPVSVVMAIVIGTRKP